MAGSAHCSLGLLACLVLGPLVAMAYSSFCPSGWFSHNGHCYGYFPQEMTWHQAEAFCQGHQGHLASILSPGEHRAVAAFLKDAQKWDDEDVWLGLSIPPRSQTWVWADGSPAGYTKWKNNNNYFGLKREPCVAMEEEYGFMVWDTDSCYDKNAVLCKT